MWNLWENLASLKEMMMTTSTCWLKYWKVMFQLGQRLNLVCLEEMMMTTSTCLLKYWKTVFQLGHRLSDHRRN